MRYIYTLTLVFFTVAAFADLPKISRTNELKMLRNFPLSENIDQRQILARYGTPDNTTKVLDTEAWSYGANVGGTKLYVFEFQNGVVVDVVVRYPGSLFNPRAATACAKRKSCNTKGRK